MYVEAEGMPTCKKLFASRGHLRKFPRKGGATEKLDDTNTLCDLLACWNIASSVLAL